jgi:protein O-GlcNAc transferase
MLAAMSTGETVSGAGAEGEARPPAPPDADALNTLGNALLGRGQLEAARAAYERALAILPDRPELHVNLGLVLHRLGRDEAAAVRLARAIALDPALAEAHNNLGTVLKSLGRRDEAAQCYARAFALRPDYAEALSNLGIVLREDGRLDEAVAHFRRAEALKPGLAEVQLNLGMVFQDLGRLDDAIAHYHRALALKPDLAEAHGDLGLALHDLGRMDEARAHHEKALALKPDLALSQIGRVTAMLPMIYGDAAEIGTSRAAYTAALEALSAETKSEHARRTLAPAVGSSQPFYLAYQGENDRALQQVYGTLVSNVMAARFPPAALPPPPAPGERLRLGIVSGFLRSHSNWKIPIRGWIEPLDRARFELYLYHTGTMRDAATEHAASLATRFVQGPLSIERWREIILADRPHALIYPEIGMDGMSAQLAGLRLAPVQMTSWGHPRTSGYPTLDYFLSSALMEPPDAASHYTERLVLLPGLGINYRAPDTAPVRLDRAALGLPEDAPVFWCGQSLYKYLPQHDALFPRIARGLGRCRFVFVGFPRGSHATALFEERLARAFAAWDLAAADHCTILPPLELARFLGAMGVCDAVLDSVLWSGCNSTLEGLVHDLPIVTFRGPLMRGRHSAAILDGMGLSDLVAETLDDYVALAVRLGCDAAFRRDVRRRIAAGKHRVFGDEACVRALEAFLEPAVRAAPENAARLHREGVAAHVRGDHRAAASLIGRALARRPDAAEMHSDLGLVLEALGEEDAALTEFEAALALDRDLAEAHNNLGRILDAHGRREDARRHFEHALQRKPALAEAHNNLANLLKDEGRFAAAVAHYEAAIGIKPGAGAFHRNLGLALQAKGDLASAIAAFEQAASLAPDRADSHYDLANALREAGRIEAAIAGYDRALALDPRHSDAHSNRGLALHLQAAFDQAEDCFRRALALVPDHANAHLNLGMTRLLRGDFAGFRDYEWRKRSVLPPAAAVPQWRGAALGGASILLHAEQGFGDTLQFARYVPLVAARGGRVVLAVQGELKRLLAGLPGVASILSLDEGVPKVEWQCPLLSLPLAFGTTLETIPASVPYLADNPALRAAWRRRIGARGGLNVGLVWSGRPSHPRDRERSLAPDQLSPLGTVPGVNFFSLQKGGDGARPAFAHDDLAPELGDFADTAAAVAALDLVITVDTATAHLAGALGVPVWVLLPRVPDWRWLMEREDSPWYPSARLLRQERAGEWAPVIARAAVLLARLAVSAG